MKNLQTTFKLAGALMLVCAVATGTSWYQNSNPIAHAIVEECSPLNNMPCSAANACGDSMPGMYNCQGVCSATTPPMPPLYGMSCVATGPANVCGSFDVAYGTYLCNSSCSAVTPEAPKVSDENENETADCLEQQETPPAAPAPSGGGGTSPAFVPTPAPTSTPSQPVVAQSKQITPPFTDLLITGPSEEEEEQELPSVLPKTGADISTNE